jgi:steroid 5-alpha reductase family enzyme
VQSASRARSFAYITVAYVVALAVAWLVARAIGAASPLAVVAWADLAATVTVFAFSIAANNTSVYDPYWSVAPIAIAPFYALHASASGAPLGRQILVCALVIAWGLRLTYNWARGFHGLSHEDWRYVDIREKTGRGYWPASFAGLHLFPTVQVYLGCLPLSVALTSARPLGPLDALAAVVTLGAILIETIADEQLRAFRRSKREPGEIMARGLWAYSRHPNYFGEIGFWWGLFLFALAVDPGAWWTGIGALAITAMFVFASIPLIDKRSAARRPEYAEHVKRVSMLVPWFPKR